MYTDEYVLKKLKKISFAEKEICEEMVKSLGEWTNVNETAKYLKKHKTTIYRKVQDGVVVTRRVGRSIVIYTRSLIFILDDEY